MKVPGVKLKSSGKNNISLLAIETATDICGIAYFYSGKLVGIEEEKLNREHAEMLPLFYDRLVKKFGFSLSDLSGIAVSIGPGSFTGLRIGLSYAKGLAFSTNISIVPIPTLVAMVWGIRSVMGTIGCILHSHRDFVYYQKITVQDNNIVEKSSPESLRWKDVPFDSDEITTICHYGFNDMLIEEKFCKPLIHTVPSARFVGEYALHNFEDLHVLDFHQLEPNYVSHFKLGKPSKLG